MMSLGFIAAALPKVLGDPMAAAAFTQAHLPVWFMYFIGVAEIIGAIGLWIKKLSFYAACGLWIILAGAVFSTALLSSAGTAVIPIVYAIILGIIVWLGKKKDSLTK